MWICFRLKSRLATFRAVTPNSQAAKCGDQEPELKRRCRSIDDLRRGVCVEEENLGLRFFVGGELDIARPWERDSPTFGPYSESK